MSEETEKLAVEKEKMEQERAFILICRTKTCRGYLHYSESNRQMMEDLFAAPENVGDYPTSAWFAHDGSTNFRINYD